MEPLHPYRVLTYGSLRFDGIKYRQEHGYEPLVAVQELLQSGRWEGTPRETLAAAFALQRWLCHWGGEQEPHDGPWWWAFRTLFLLSVEWEVPIDYRGPRWAVWDRDYLPRLTEAVAAVRQEHESTLYPSNLAP